MRPLEQHLVALDTTPIPPTPQRPNCGTRFAQTGKCLGGRFLTYWQANGGLAINGYPITDEFPETLEDGKRYCVRDLDEVRMEYQP